jgi:Major capsid protein N-terminus/Large eukaryotic DNA virus major capsid protein
MAGGLLQLVAYGSQDLYLTGHPQITYFRIVYRRHTNFSTESIQQTFSGNPNFGSRVTTIISRNGDLIHRMYLQVTLPEVEIQGGARARWVNWVGHALIDTIEIEVGGQKIDRHYGRWMHIWNELTQTPGRKAGYAKMVGNTPELTNIYKSSATSGATVTIPSRTLYIPTIFWFNRNAGLALPLIALQYHEVKINIQFATLDKCLWSCLGDIDSNGRYVNGVASGRVTPKGSIDATLYVDYIFLDNTERKKFAAVCHEYLIEQLQTYTEGVSNTTHRLKLNFNHPVKYLIWTLQCDAFTDRNSTTNHYLNVVGGPQQFNFTDGFDMTYEVLNTYNDAAGSDGLSQSGGGGGMGGMIGPGGGGMIDPFDAAGGNPVLTAQLQLNGTDRFSTRNGDYFNLVQPYQAFPNCPSEGINLYAFCLSGAEHQPSGTCNMSRIDNCSFNMTFTKAALMASDGRSQGTATLECYGVAYNVFKIMSGMAGVAYANIFPLKISGSVSSPEDDGYCWLVDSGASDHMTSDKSLLHEYAPSDITLYLSDGSSRKVEGTGNVSLPITVDGRVKMVHLRGVLYVPDLAFNLISLSRVISDGYSVAFDKKGCIIRDENGSVIATADRSASGLYGIHPIDEEAAPPQTTCREVLPKFKPRASRFLQYPIESY